MFLHFISFHWQRHPPPIPFFDWKTVGPIVRSFSRFFFSSLFPSVFSFWVCTLRGLAVTSWESTHLDLDLSLVQILCPFPVFFPFSVFLLGCFLLHRLAPFAAILWLSITRRSSSPPFLLKACIYALITAFLRICMWPRFCTPRCRKVIPPILTFALVHAVAGQFFGRLALAFPSFFFFIFQFLIHGDLYVLGAVPYFLFLPLPLHGCYFAATFRLSRIPYPFSPLYRRFPLKSARAVFSLY